LAERVLVTGGAGFIGLHLVRRLLADGTDITLLDDFSRGRVDTEFAAMKDSVRLVRHDLTLPLPDDMLSADFDVVYHLAAVVGVQHALSRPAHVLRTNILATENLLNWCDRHTPGAVFLSSTSEVGDGAVAAGLAGHPTPERAPFTVADLFEARASYSLSKAVSEAMLLQRAERYRVRIGRYYNIYGPRMGSSHVIPQFIERIRAGVDPFAMYGAHQTRAFCYVADAVASTIGLVGLPASEPLTVNIGNDLEEIEIIELARRLFELTGVDPRLDIQPPPPGSPDRRLPDVRRLRELLPGRDVTPLADGLRAMIEWYDR
jgi:UDP-glucuronate decarboxylase